MMDEWNRNRTLPPDRGAFDQDEKDQASKRREREERRKEALDEELDRGLEDTFPGSDPVAITQPPHSARDKRKPQAANGSGSFCTCAEQAIELTRYLALIRWIKRYPAQ
jgi:hypothetical protein